MAEEITEVEATCITDTLQEVQSCFYMPLQVEKAEDTSSRSRAVTHLCTMLLIQSAEVGDSSHMT